MSTVNITRADGSTYEAESNDARVVHGVDSDGFYLGLVPRASCDRVVKGPPRRPHMRYIDEEWRFVPPLALAKANAVEEIDKLAGTARLRFITDCPGQEGTYREKFEQAKAYLDAGGVGTVPPYVQAEADAMDVTPMQAAQSIYNAAVQWRDVIGPQIELVRRRGTVRVIAASSLDEIETILRLVRFQLNQIV